MQLNHQTPVPVQDVCTSSDIPHPENFCGGNFQDWLEVNLLPECNAKCSWCIENNGYHPSHKASWRTIVDTILKTNKTNIILLGGEPTLYKDLKLVIDELSQQSRNVWITTNGCRINNSFAESVLKNITGVNISIHHYDLNKNFNITRLNLREQSLIEGIKRIHINGGTVRLNCNLIRGYIDSKSEIYEYVAFAKKLGADNIRFAELKMDEGNFVNLNDIFDTEFGLNYDPFKLGCHKNGTINGLSVNFRQMCGLQTNCRKRPINPVQFKKEVVYYDGKIYAGWQSPTNLSDNSLQQLLDDYVAGKINKTELKKFINNH